jgi:hypothetical protein
MNPTDRMPQDRINEIEQQANNIAIQKIQFEIRKLELEVTDFRRSRRWSIFSTALVPLIVAIASGIILWCTGWFNTQNALIAMRQRDLDTLNKNFGLRELDYKMKDSVLKDSLAKSREALKKLDSIIEANKKLDAQLSGKNFSRDASLTRATKEVAKLKVEMSSKADSLAILKHSLNLAPGQPKDLTTKIWFLQGELYSRDELISSLQAQLKQKQ